MKHILEHIIERNSVSLEERKKRIPAAELERRARSVPARPSLAKALCQSGVRVIAELKSASPSRGVIRADFRPVELASELAENGAAALSVLTEEHFFQGSPTYLERVSETVDIPLLCKDFIVDPYQVLEAKCYGASALLLIAEALSDARLRILIHLALELGLEILAEAHSAAEIDRMLTFPVTMIGVNARNLDDFSTSLEASAALLGRIPARRIPVAESAIASRADIERLRRAGARGFLIGETLMRSAHPGETLRGLL